MTPLSDAERQLVFDYSFGLVSGRAAADAEQLLSSNREASQLHELLRAALSPLESICVEPCPDELAERTIQRLRERARTVGPRRDLLPTAATGPDTPSLAAPRRDPLSPAVHPAAVPVRVPLWRNWAEIAAVAAVLVLFLSILVPALTLARQRHWQAQCQSHFAGIGEGLAHYAADHQGQFPTVATAQDAPWWKVGTQGPETPSNARRAFLLVKHGYVPLAAFTCPGRRDAGRPDPDTVRVGEFNDFPARAFIHYSVRIDPRQTAQPALGRKKVFMADLNPLSEEFPRDFSSSPSIELHDRLLRVNSRNHGRHGQNLLFDDGAVEFTKTRRTSFSDDDIYALQSMACGQKIHGDERPASDTDTFVAP